MLKDEFGTINPFEEQKVLEKFFVLPLKSKVSWFFVQGFQAIHRGLYLPGNLSLFNGIEISIRQTLHLVAGKSINADLDRWQIMKDPMLKMAHLSGLPIGALSFPGEDIIEAITSGQSTSKIVSQRNNFCHGNVHEFVQYVTGDPDNKFFTPECTRELANILMEISEKWVLALTEFCKLNGILA